MLMIKMWLLCLLHSHSISVIQLARVAHHRKSDMRVTYYYNGSVLEGGCQLLIVP